jgi:hypothetical protein
METIMSGLLDDLIADKGGLQGGKATIPMGGIVSICAELADP